MHPNLMAAWPEIACQRGHNGPHRHRRVSVALGGPTPYKDLPPIPLNLGRQFTMNIWSSARYPVDGGPYCPAHDTVSDTVLRLGVWEPTETIVALDLLSGGILGATLLDFGAQIGWYSWLALASGANVIAFEADAENARLMSLTAADNNWSDRIDIRHVRITDTTPPPTIPWRARLAKIDVEGAEPAVIDYLSSSLQQGLIDFLLVEISPVFHDGYPDMIARLIDWGYQPYRLPPKDPNPRPLAARAGDLRNDLTPVQGLDTCTHQEDFLFAHRDARW